MQCQMWVNKTVQEMEIATIKEEVVVADHNQEISLEEEEEAMIAEGTMIVLMEMMMPMAKMTMPTTGTLHLNPRSSVLPRISRAEQKN